MAKGFTRERPWISSGASLPASPHRQSQTPLRVPQSASQGYFELPEKAGVQSLWPDACIPYGFAWILLSTEEKAVASINRFKSFYLAELEKHYSLLGTLCKSNHL